MVGTSSPVAPDWPCPLCGGATRRQFEAHGYGVRACHACGHRCAELAPGGDHVRNVYDDDYFFGGGAGYPDYLAEEDELRERGARYATLVEGFAPPGRVLDVGAAAGFTLLEFQERGWEAFGLEPNPRMAALGRERFGLPVSTATLASFRDEAGPYDLVVMLQVIAHLVDPRAEMRRVVELVRPGGLFLVETWDRKSWTARLFGRRWHEYSPPSVLHWFARQGLSELARGLGFQPIATGRPRRRVRGRHARSLVEHAFDGSFLAPVARRSLRLLPEAASIPYPGDDLFWVLYRKGAGA